MNSFTMWKDKIVFIDGWFVYMDDKGNNSIISHEQARMLESHFEGYQAEMSVDRGGASEEFAYSSRGFTRKGDEYIYEKFDVDQLIVGNVNPIPNILQIPRNVGNIKINSIASEAFKNELAIEKVILHSDIHTIGESAFEGCKNLNDISLANENIEIKKDAFKDTSLFLKQAAITGRKDKKSIIIYAPSMSTANKYCSKYGQKYNLIFKPLAKGLFSKFFKK